MRALARFLVTTAIGGITFLLPVVLLIILVNHAVRIIHPVVKPLAAVMPGDTFTGHLLATAISIGLIVAICLVAGIIARTRVAHYIKDSIERRLEQRIPLYRLVRGAIQGLTKAGSDSGIIPVLARFDDAWQLGFILEEHGDGISTVFIPQSPTPMVGTVYYMEEARLKRLNITVGRAFQCMAQLGLGSRELLRQQS